jgi:chromosome partitioning protein
LIVELLVLMLANNAINQRTTKKTIATISQKGGARNTTVAIHPAVDAEQRGLKSALFDLDPQASASCWSNKRNNPSPSVISSHAANPSRRRKQAEGLLADFAVIDSATSANAPLQAAARRPI